MNPFFEKLLLSEDEPQKIKLLYKRLEESDPAIPRILDKLSATQVGYLYKIITSSHFLFEELTQHPEWLKEDIFNEEDLLSPMAVSVLRHELSELMVEEIANRDFEATGRLLREFKLKHIFRIAVRDLNKLCSTEQIILELSNLADLCLQSVFRLSWLQLTEKIGVPYYKDGDGNWVRSDFSIIGLGKLGGQELNYSSDVDVIFVYSEEGFVFKETPEPGDIPGSHALNNHQFFTRLAESIISEVSKSTREGWLYRIDLRLRPEGSGGPLVRSLESYENYYAQWGRTWERMMLIKARYVAGSSSLAADFIDMIHPFRYPRNISEQVPGEVAEMKDRIEKEVVKSGELQRNVKLGQGGIREIEFIVQTIQVLHAGRMPYLQGGQTLPLLEKLAVYGQLPTSDSLLLIKAYRFYRDVEHRLQIEENQQTHTLPQSPERRQRLALLTGFKNTEEFDKQREQFQKEVRRVFEKVIHSENTADYQLDDPDHNASQNISLPLPPDFDDYEGEWKDLLVRIGFKTPEVAYKLIRTFVMGPGYVHVSKRTVELGWKLLPRIFQLCPSEQRIRLLLEQPGFQVNMRGRRAVRIFSDPDRVLARLDSFIQNYGGRQGLYENWFSSPFTLDLLLLLFDRSEYLAEIAIKTPSLFEEIMDDGQIRRSKDEKEILRDLEYGLEDADQHQWIRLYHRAELMRIALRDLMGLTDFTQNQKEINALGDACIQYALKVVMKKFRLKKPPFAVIGMGKFGGRELTYGSDLDIMFVCPARWKGTTKVQKMGFMLTNLLSMKTALGSAYKTDSRLRPDGEKGILVNTLTRYERYYRNRAQLWEIQSLTRARVVCGDVETGFQFMDMARNMTNFTIPRRKVSAYRDDWKNTILQMRLKVEKERTPYGKDHLAFKTGTGGLMDVEFLAQMLNMEYGWFQPNTRKALRLAASQDYLNGDDAQTLIENFDNLMYLEKVLRRWSYEGESVLPDTDAPLLRVAIRCGFNNIEAFLNAVRKWRTDIREVYSRLTGSDTGERI